MVVVYFGLWAKHPPLPPSSSKMSNFASSVMLGDLNDFISPSQACVNPIFAGDKSSSNEAQNSESVGLPKIGLQLENDFGSAMDFEMAPPTPAPSAPDLIKTSDKKTAKVSLSDCLACSGCVTSAETVLIEQQSADEFERKIASGDYDAVVVTLSSQSRASLAVHFEAASASEMQQRISNFLRKRKRVSFVLDATLAGDLALVEQSREFIHRFKAQQARRATGQVKLPWQAPPTSAAVSSTSTKLDPNSPDPQIIEHGGEVAPGDMTPLIASACPGWICYAEKSCPEAIPFISTTKSPQQIAGSLIKDLVSRECNIPASRILHATVMPCADKKLEASRNDFYHAQANARDVDVVLTTTELAEMMNADSGAFSSFAESAPAVLPSSPEAVQALENTLSSLADASIVGASASDGGSGGYLDFIFRSAAKELFNVDVPNGPLPFKQGRNADIRTVELHVQGKPALCFASAYGFRNIQHIIRQLKRGKCKYDYVEIMACPSGCLNGGGQVRPPKETTSEGVFVNEAAGQRDRLANVDQFFHSRELRSPLENPRVGLVYKNWVSDEPYSAKSRRMLHTRFHTVPKLENGLAQVW